MRSARDLYLESLDSSSELSARRLAERSGIPDNDPIWLLLHELHRSLAEVVGSANAALANDAFATRLSTAVAASIAHDDSVLDQVAAAIRTTQDGSLRALRTLESAVGEFARRQAVAPLSSIAFAVALAIAATAAAIWGTFHVATTYGQDIGYHSGFYDGIRYARSHR